MDHQAGILQQRIEIAPFQRCRQQPCERVGGEQQKRQEADADQRQGTDHPRDDLGRQPPRIQRHRAGPQRQDQRPQQQRALVRTPHRGVAVHQRQQRVGVLGDIGDREILGHERMGEDGEGAGDQRQLRERRRPRHAHPARIAALRAGQRQHGLQHGGEQGQDQQELANLRQHGAEAGTRHRARQDALLGVHTENRTSASSAERSGPLHCMDAARRCP
ncbi:hypothetical protein QE400_003013 [Xanthomonas sacchari]|nr:hypothetical protein [Xanthomonas sacchari]